MCGKRRHGHVAFKNVWALVVSLSVWLYVWVWVWALVASLSVRLYVWVWVWALVVIMQYMRFHALYVFMCIACMQHINECIWIYTCTKAIIVRFSIETAATWTNSTRWFITAWHASSIVWGVLCMCTHTVFLHAYTHTVCMCTCTQLQYI